MERGRGAAGSQTLQERKKQEWKKQEWKEQEWKERELTPTASLATDRGGEIGAW